MLCRFSTARWLTLSCAALLASCGGGPSGDGDGTTPVTPVTTLTVSTMALALATNEAAVAPLPALTGTPRVFTITNTGSVPALSVAYALGAGSPALPMGTTAVSTCATLAAGASCQITITPGNTASALAGDASPVPVTLDISGSNTNTLSPTVQVLTYGSAYQGGYVFAIDDTTPGTGSVGGKVVARDESASVMWSSSGGTVVYNAIPGINENSGAPCNGANDGACNTEQIVAFNPGLDSAAGVCSASTASGYSDWYLPAVCELNDQAVAGCGVNMDNVQRNLVDHPNIAVAAQITSLPNVIYWSSTGSSGIPAPVGQEAWVHYFERGINALSYEADKNNPFAFRCVRPLTL